MAHVILNHLKKIYPSEKGSTKKGGVLAVEDFNIDIQDGEFIVLVGPSGCGKSTTLRMIAGLEEISEGHAYVDDKEITNLAAKDRDMAMVFQNYALYAHMTVYQNMAFSLMLRKEKEEVIHEKVMKAAEILDLKTQLNKKPSALSGGQRQRVALGRAIVRNPKVFLFDEPLSNLDAKLRSSMRRELKLLHKKLNATILYVTHDQIEALTLASRIVVMSMGKVQQIDTPVNIYSNPSNLFVAGFIGNPPMNFIEGKVSSSDLAFYSNSSKFVLPKETIEIIKRNNYLDMPVVLGFRPEHCIEDGNIECVIDIEEHLGQSTLIHAYLGEEKIIIKLPGWLEHESGTKINIGFDGKLICLFDKESGNRIR